MSVVERRLVQARPVLLVCALVFGCGGSSDEEEHAAPNTVACDAGAACSPPVTDEELSRDEFEKQLDRIEQEITAPNQRRR
jgi:hypothetical protein